MIFTVSTRKYLGDAATVATQDEQGHEIPVLHVIAGEDRFPGDPAKLAANIASYLNGNDPLYDVKAEQGKRLFWCGHETGFELRVQEDGGAS